MILTIIFAVLWLIVFLGAIYTGYRRAAEIANNNNAEAAKWEALMLVFNTLLGSMIVVLVLLNNQELMGEGFAKVFRYLEVLAQ